MADDLKISYPEIPLASSVSAASSEDADFPHENLFYGSSTLLWKTAANVTQSTITIDLGSGNTATVDHVIFRGADLLIAEADNEVDLSLRASTDNFSASDVSILSTSNITSTDLTGPHNEDIILTAATSSAYRYWRVQIDSVTSFKHLLRKCYFGNFFTFNDSSPVYPYEANYSDVSKPFVSDGGHLFRTSSGKRTRKYNFTYTGVSDSTRNSFDSSIAKYLNDVPVFLYEPSASSHSALNGHGVIYGWLNAGVISGDAWKDTNQVDLTFVEDLA